MKYLELNQIEEKENSMTSHTVHITEKKNI